MNLEAKLKEIFGYDNFRNGQKQIIEQVLDGQATLGIYPQELENQSAISYQLLFNQGLLS